MTKKEIQQRVLKDGKPLALAKFKWDPKTNEFSSKEFGLVFDFLGISGITFNTGRDCIFDTGSDCTFKTGSYCIFKTDYHCTFKTGHCCTFNLDFDCIWIANGMKFDFPSLPSRCSRYAVNIHKSNSLKEQKHMSTPKSIGLVVVSRGVAQEYTPRHVDIRIVDLDNIDGGDSPEVIPADCGFEVLCDQAGLIEGKDFVYKNNDKEGNSAESF